MCVRISLNYIAGKVVFPPMLRIQEASAASNQSAVEFIQQDKITLWQFRAECEEKILDEDWKT